MNIKTPPFQLLPDPWSPVKFLDDSSAGGLGAPAAANWSANNRACYVPVIFPADCILYAMYARGGDTDGNYDLGLYDGLDFKRMVSKGSTANANARLTLSLADVQVTGGKLYYAAFAWSSSASSVWRHAMGTNRATLMLGMLMEESAFPLPATMTGIDNTADQLPLFSFGIR